MSYMGKVTGGVNFFGVSEPNFKGLLKPHGVEWDAYQERLRIYKFDEVGEFKTMPEGFLRMLDIELGLLTFCQLSDVFKLGAGISAGFSGSKEKHKSWESLSISEGFILKLGVAAKVTEWVMLSAVLRISMLSYEVNWSQEEEIGAAWDEVGKCFHYPRFKHDVNTQLVGSSWVIGWYGDANVLIPITENIKAVITVGMFGSNETEFKVKRQRLMDLHEPNPTFHNTMVHLNTAFASRHRGEEKIESAFQQLLIASFDSTHTEVELTHELEYPEGKKRLVTVRHDAKVTIDGKEVDIKDKNVRLSLIKAAEPYGIYSDEDITAKLSSRIGLRIAVGVAFEF